MSRGCATRLGNAEREAQSARIDRRSGSVAARVPGTILRSGEFCYESACKRANRGEVNDQGNLSRGSCHRFSFYDGSVFNAHGYRRRRRRSDRRCCGRTGRSSGWRRRGRRGRCGFRGNDAAARIAVLEQSSKRGGALRSACPVFFAHSSVGRVSRSVVGLTGKNRDRVQCDSRRQAKSTVPSTITSASHGGNSSCASTCVTR
jgi:hypothetical protein